MASPVWWVAVIRSLSSDPVGWVVRLLTNSTDI